ncbi:MAG: porin family protein [Deltaproteobacteria bacterium]|nr:porin family protein [Deltaproteobacteria bacterium]MBW2417483.1 porin family protein [Deltaproteobacteria bacterium]
MTLRTLTTALSLAIALTFSSAALAQDDDEESGPDFARPGPYVTAGFNASFLDWNTVQNLADAQKLKYSIDPSYGFTAGVGYRLSPRLAVEAQVDYGFDTDIEVDDSKSGEMKSWATTFDFKGYLLTGPFQPFGVVGLGAAYVKGAAGVDTATPTIDETGFVIRFGGGLDSYITENIAIFVDGSWILMTGRLSDVDYATVGAGLMYRF